MLKKKSGGCGYNRGIGNLQGAIGGFWADVGTVQKISKSLITSPLQGISENPPGEILTYECIKNPPEDINFALGKKKVISILKIRTPP